MGSWIRRLWFQLMKRLCFFLLPIGLSFGVSILIDIGVQSWQHTTPAIPEEIEFSVRKYGLNSTKSCLEIYKTESYEVFERLCRITDLSSFASHKSSPGSPLIYQWGGMDLILVQ